jgi:hypothetical protein
MEMTVSDFRQLGKRVTLVGRLDIPGAAKIDVPLKEIADSRTNIVVDMSGLHCLAWYAQSRGGGQDAHAQWPDAGSAEPDAAVFSESSQATLLWWRSRICWLAF